MAKPKKRERRKKAVHLAPEQVREGEKVAKALLGSVHPFVKPDG
ncbi:MAG: hypothetical protein OXM57_13890 [bacterium]|nr:hypothetical protein [bacterium]MDE0353769.1 hypothetical protein [bacterium]